MVRKGRVYNLYGFRLQSEMQLACPLVETPTLLPDIELVEYSASDLHRACEPGGMLLETSDFYEFTRLHGMGEHVSILALVQPSVYSTSVSLSSVTFPDYFGYLHASQALANSTCPAEFLHDNLAIQMNVIHAGQKAPVSRENKSSTKTSACCEKPA
jgi:hypothetical protein